MKRIVQVGWVAAALLVGCSTSEVASTTSQSPRVNRADAWRGVHLFVQTDEAVDGLAEELPNLAAIGVNNIVVQVGYSFDFKSHPEVAGRKPITRPHAKALAEAARKYHIRLIPEIDCLGHQSTQKFEGPLLRSHPEFMEPVGSNIDPKASYLHSWCPLHPEVNKVVFDLIDEVAEAFDADAFHVGMDEVFSIASDKCPRCHGKDPAKLFAKAVNGLHQHIVEERKMEMMMWGDRLLDSEKLGYSKWEASKNGTAGAVDLIPKDIVVCDWHYEKRSKYPSVPFLLNKGFRVWPSGWQPLEASKAFSDFARRQNNPHLVGYLCTAWSKANVHTAATWPPFVDVLKDWRE